jgi:hypothetical protein
MRPGFGLPPNGRGDRERGDYRSVPRREPELVPEDDEPAISDAEFAALLQKAKEEFLEQYGRQGPRPKPAPWERPRAPRRRRSYPRGKAR